ncbi:ATP-grasp domain-containing protein [Streptomyces sp. NPDC055897]
MSETTQPKAAAFILLGGFGVVCRNPLYLAELRRRGLRILLLTPESFRPDVQAAAAQPEHPVHQIDEIAYVAGALGLDGSFTSGVISRAMGWRERHRIVGVYAVGEVMVEPTGLLADALGLRSPGLRATRVCRSKYLQRWYLHDVSPASTTIAPSDRSSFTADTVPFPCIVKPSGRHSSSGVQTVQDPARLAAALNEYPDHETLLVEQKIEGQEYSVESLVQDGQVVFASATCKETTGSHAHTFVELSHSVPTARGSVSDVLLAANAKVLSTLMFEDGIAHSEWRLDASGRPFLMEIAARTPGDGLLVLYELATGEALEPHILRTALGEPTTYPAPRRCTRQVYVEHRPGRLLDVRLDWPNVTPAWLGSGGLWPVLQPGAADDPPTLRALFVLTERNAVLAPLASSDDRVVTFFIDAATHEELDELEQRVHAALTVDVD